MLPPGATAPPPFPASLFSYVMSPNMADNYGWDGNYLGKKTAVAYSGLRNRRVYLAERKETTKKSELQVSCRDSKAAPSDAFVSNYIYTSVPIF